MGKVFSLKIRETPEGEEIVCPVCLEGVLYPEIFERDGILQCFTCDRFFDIPRRDGMAVDLIEVDYTVGEWA